jgi:endonuclease G
VLRNAVTERQRICVFAGPVFRDDDPAYRFNSQLPMRFWKIAVWAADGALHSVAVIADQKPVLEQLTEGVPEALGPRHGQEAFDDADELARVSQFLTTVADIEELTGLDFGSPVRDVDINAGGERMRLDGSMNLEAIARPRPDKRLRRLVRMRRTFMRTPSSRTGESINASVT